MDFDLSAIPSASKIQSAELFLFALSQSEYKDNSFHLSLLAEDYDVSTVTWVQRDSQNSWRNPGGTWISSPQAIITIPSQYSGGWHFQTGDVNQWYSWDCADMLQSVVDWQLEFKGFILRQRDIENSRENQAMSFAAMHHSDESLRPYLLVTFE